MPRIVLVIAAAALLTAGCGADPTASRGGPTSGTSGQSSSSSPAATTASFPLAITRRGGVAGFSDTITVQQDGSVRAVTRSGRVACTLEAASLAALSEAAAEIRDTDTPTAPTSPVANAMTVLIGVGSGLVSIDDPRVARSAPLVTHLLAEVTGPAAERRICT